MAKDLSTGDFESLIEDLAQGLCSTCGLTPEQNILSIPWAMVYLAGLVLSRYDNGSDGTHPHCHLKEEDVVPVIPDSAHEQLRRFCEIYNQYIGKKGQPLQVVAMMSPRVCPSTEQQLVIQQDIANKAKTNAVLQELLLSAGEEEMTKENATSPPLAGSKSKKKKKSKQTQSVTALLETSTSTSNKVRSSSTKDTIQESLEEVIRIHLNTTNGIDHSLDRDDWIDVPSLARTATRANYSPVPVSLPAIKKVDPNTMRQTPSTQYPYTPTSPMESQNGLSENSYLAAARAGQTTAKSSDSQMQQAVLQQSNRGIIDEQQAENNQNDLTVNSLESMRRRIMELEEAMALSSRLLLEERRQFTNELKEERERHVNSMQALQLRLYISETRLKTYQDALEEHIHSVAENVYHPNGSPPRRLCQEKDRKSPPPASPLMSRVLQKSNRLDESF